MKIEVVADFKSFTVVVVADGHANAEDARRGTSLSASGILASLSGSGATDIACFRCGRLRRARTTRCEGIGSIY